MVAQSSANFPIFRGPARQRGRDFGALAQTLGRTVLPYFKNVVPAAKTIGTGLIEIGAPKIGEVVSGQKNSKHLQKVLEQKQFEKCWEV